MRICLASIHPRMLSGQIESLIALRAGLESLGHTVRLVSAFHPDWLRQDRRWATDFGDGLAVAPKVIRIGRIFTAAAAAARDCDVLHFNLPTPAFAILADILHTVTQKPVVVGFEAHLADVPRVGRRMAAAPEFYAPRLVINNGLVARLTARRAQAYVVSSHYQQAELTALGYRAEQVHVIPNLIDEAKLKRSPQVDARRELGLPAGPLVAFVGHFHDVKGHDVLIEAFRRVLIKVPQAHLALAWSGIGNRGRVRRAIARAGISDAVIELGRLDVGQLFSAADVTALPYRFSIGQAAFPGTLIEAMWVGVPLVTSDLPLLRELSEDGRTALLAPPGDPDQLAQPIVRLLSDPALAAQVVDAQRAVMAARFEAGQVIRRYVGVYEQALRRAALPVRSAEQKA